MKPTQHVPAAIRISEESHTGATQFIPYCDKQGCHWIGEPHLDWSSAHREGTGHLDDIWRLSEIRRLSPPPRAIPAVRVA